MSGQPGRGYPLPAMATLLSVNLGTARATRYADAGVTASTSARRASRGHFGIRDRSWVSVGRR